MIKLSLFTLLLLSCICYANSRKLTGDNVRRLQAAGEEPQVELSSPDMTVSFPFKNGCAGQALVDYALWECNVKKQKNAISDANAIALDIAQLIEMRIGFRTCESPNEEEVMMCNQCNVDRRLCKCVYKEEKKKRQMGMQRLHHPNNKYHKPH